jgi:hypothetical protein
MTKDSDTGLKYCKIKRREEGEEEQRRRKF